MHVGTRSFESAISEHSNLSLSMKGLYQHAQNVTIDVIQDVAVTFSSRMSDEVPI